jgi:hypothetical protein
MKHLLHIRPVNKQTKSRVIRKIRSKYIKNENRIVAKRKVNNWVKTNKLKKYENKKNWKNQKN